ncbi:hypothetical protein GJAV_G00062670 [Gymnothorax javanicus]|nr:hypothetical protein GJAV_G00062670 [Gymnothorax javanicus]
MDYAGDSHDLESQDNPLEHKEEVKPLIDAYSEILPTEGSQSMEKIPFSSDYEPEEGEGAEKIEGSLAEQDNEPVAEREDLEEMTSASQEEGQNEGEGRSNDTQESKNNVEFEEGPSIRQAVVGREEEERNRNDSVTYSKGKVYKQKKDRRAEKPSEILDEEKQGFQQKGNMEKETDLVENTAQEVNKRTTGKSATLAGLNPVQIRANEELYPFERVSLDESTQEALVNPCANFRCKRGKTCKVSDKNEPSCFCQDPMSCAPSTTEIENVCGTDNKTYDTSCALFATKCKLEGTKRRHQLHLDYTGSCKYIAPCQEGELLQFPLRMRDWLKNVLLQLYERDMRAPGFLLPKQRVKVQKIYESERRLHGDDHPIELLIRDFHKNYHMYIYPVHWQFAQLDQHPADRFLSHSELAPLRVPLVPMEHCTSLFFKQCDADKDRLVSFKEWGNCFGIKDEDMDLNLLI